MKLVMKKENFENASENPNRRSWDNVIPFNIDVFTVTPIKDTRHLQLSAEIAFKNKYLSIESLRKRVEQSLSNLVQAGVVEVIYSQKDIEEVFKQIKSIDEKARTITLKDDLSFENDHPLIKDISLSGWEKNGPQFELENPFYYEKDIQKLEFEDFHIEITPTQKVKLTELRDKQTLLLGKVYVFPSPNGYTIFAHSLNSDIIQKIAEKGKVKYHVQDDAGILVPKTLEFITSFFIQTTDPEIYHDLSEKGYKAFECKMFTLPAIEQLFTKNNIQIIGLEKVYPDFPKFDFELQNIEEKPNFKKLDFQTRAITNWENANKLGTIALPTGSGKTIIALMAMSRLKLKTLIVTPTIEMLFQWKQMLIDWLGVPENKIGLYYSDEKVVNDITIITFQSGHRKVRKETESENDEVTVDDSLVNDISKLSETVGLLIADEGHHLPAAKFQTIMTNVKSRYRMSLTATPYREDKNETLAFLAMGDVVLHEDYYTLAQQKIVSPISYNRIIVSPTKIEEDILEFKGKASAGEYYYSGGYGNTYRDDDAIEADKKTMIELWNDHKYVQIKQELDPKYEVKSTRSIHIRKLFGFAENKFAKLEEIMQKHKNNKVLIFNEFVEGTEIIQHFLQEKGYLVHVITGSTDTDERAKIFEQFKSSTQFILCTTTVLDEGINVPDTDVVIIFNASRSKRQMIQRVGRGCRYQKGKVEYVYELVMAPADAGRKKVDSGKLYWREGYSDDFIINRMRTYRDDGKVTSDTKVDTYRQSMLEVEKRTQLLYEYEKMLFRDITKIINLEGQNELIANLTKNTKVSVKEATTQ